MEKYEIIDILPGWCYLKSEYEELINSIDYFENDIAYRKIKIEEEDELINSLLDI